MSKLPPEFIKSPGPEQRPRKTRKASLVTAEPAPDPREVVIRLTDEDRAALEDARETLRREGEDVTVEQMIQRVIAEWRTRALTAPAPAAAPMPAPQDERLLDRLREFAAAPLRTWRELGARLHRIRTAGMVVLFGPRA